MKRVLIVSMKESSGYVTRVQSMLSSLHAQISLANELEPKSLSTRMDLVLNCDVVVILATMKLQRSMKMMEMAVAAYEKYKIMVVFPVEMGYRPFGVLGGIAQTNDDCSEAHLDTVTPEEFNKAVCTHVKSLIRVDLGSLDAMTAPPKPNGNKVVVHAAPDTEVTVKKLEEAFKKQGVPVTKISSIKLNSVKDCAVYIPVVSQQFFASKYSEREMEQIREQHDCHVRAVTTGTNMANAPPWARLGLAGKKMFKMDDFEALGKEVKKLAKVSDDSDLLQIQATEDDLNEAISFLA